MWILYTMIAKLIRIQTEWCSSTLNSHFSLLLSQKTNLPLIFCSKYADSHYINCHASDYICFDWHPSTQVSEKLKSAAREDEEQQIKRPRDFEGKIIADGHRWCLMRFGRACVRCNHRTHIRTNERETTVMCGGQIYIIWSRRAPRQHEMGIEASSREREKWRRERRSAEFWMERRGSRL